MKRMHIMHLFSVKALPEHGIADGMGSWHGESKGALQIKSGGCFQSMWHLMDP
jgi:hypothetical protein